MANSLDNQFQPWVQPSIRQWLEMQPKSLTYHANRAVELYRSLMLYSPGLIKALLPLEIVTSTSGGAPVRTKLSSRDWLRWADTLTDISREYGFSIELTRDFHGEDSEMYVKALQDEVPPYAVIKFPEELGIPRSSVKTRSQHAAKGETVLEIGKRGQGHSRNYLVKAGTTCWYDPSGWAGTRSPRGFHKVRAIALYILLYPALHEYALDGEAVLPGKRIYEILCREYLGTLPADLLSKKPRVEHPMMLTNQAPAKSVEGPAKKPSLKHQGDLARSILYRESIEERLACLISAESA